MRFIADGPSIPDELLLARDQGRVIFFCGAGVSRAKAGLHDFFGLATAVARKLRVRPDEPAMKIISEIGDVSERTGIEGLISADRIFGLLERSFRAEEIQEAVARALTPDESVDHTAHNTLLRLATTRQGLVRLVTTNFDRLFDKCRADLRSFLPPQLPNGARAREFDGVVYLHGKINAQGDGADGDGFVLSSSDFGRAYLSEGWATSFVKDLLTRYYVVFVGYSADDPPVQYLLEALNRTNGPMAAVYAFQAGDSNYANSRWRHKGVTPIPYDADKRHSALWNTLEAWAVRADDPEAWTRSVVSMAGGDPVSLKPHERGQVAHLVSTIEGLRRFSEGDPVPPASWLFVFDPFRRYAKPGLAGRWGDKERPFIDPFESYCLDSDPVPPKVDPENHYAKRETPPDVFDAFGLNKLDRVGLKDGNVGQFRGYWARSLPHLPARQFQIGRWLSKVAHDPNAVWWAANQTALHPEVRDLLAWRLDEVNSGVSTAVWKAWRYLFDVWNDRPEPTARDGIAFSRLSSKTEWNDAFLRRFATFARPFLAAGPGYNHVRNLADKEEWRVQDFIHLDVKYPEVPHKLSVPDRFLAQTVGVLRKTLEIAVELEKEIGGYRLSDLSPINPDDDMGIDRHSRFRGLSAWLLYYVSQLRTLIAIDLDAGRNETSLWPRADDTVFARLRIWSLGQSDLVPEPQFALVLDAISAEAFWENHHARDLLTAVSARWKALGTVSRRSIEARLLEGPPRWHEEDDDHFVERRAWSVANRLTWLGAQGCEFGFDFNDAIAQLRAQAPKWQPEYAKHAAQSLEGRSGMVRTETDHSGLEGVPVTAIVAKASELSGRRGEYFVEYDPFAGLAGSQPVRAFAALRFEAKRGEYPVWAWRAFLNSERRKKDPECFTGYVAERIAHCTPEAIAGILQPLCAWIREASKIIATRYPELFERLVSKVTAALATQTEETKFIIVRGNEETDWTMEALNSPTGNIAQALFYDPTWDRRLVGQGLPKAWSEMVSRILVLPGDMRRHGIVIFSHQLSWLFAVDPVWTKENLLSIFVGKSEQDREALWAGFLWGANAQGYDFFAIVKPHLLQMAASIKLEKRGQTEVISALILSAWIYTHESGERWVTDDELHSLLIESGDDFRRQILWQAKIWASEKGEKWTNMLIQLLRDVWPRHLVAKSGIVSASLCDIAFSDEAHFQQLSQIILPLLTKADVSHLLLPELRQSGGGIVDKHPYEALALLHAVLPENVNAWPYGIGETLARLEEADATLRHDERLIELKRLWDSR